MSSSSSTTRTMIRSLFALRRKQRWIQQQIILPLSNSSRHSSHSSSSHSSSSSSHSSSSSSSHSTTRTRHSSSQRRRLKHRLLAQLRHKKRVFQQASPELQRTAQHLVSSSSSSSSSTEDTTKENDPAASATTSSSSSSSSTSSSSLLAQHYYQQLKTIPNMLTLSRMAMAPAISYWIIMGDLNTAGLACCVAGITDVLDGAIAKTWPDSQQTTLGTYLDPAADKILINTVACSLGYTGVLPLPLVTLWMAKDVTLMTATYFHVKAQIPDARSVSQVIDPTKVPLQVHPTRTGKLNTGLQFATLAVALYQGPGDVLTALSWITGTTTILSVASYWDYGAFEPIGKR